MRTMYKIKSLVDGFKVDPIYRGMKLVAIPEKRVKPMHSTLVGFENETMVIPANAQPLKRIQFQDKFSRDPYWLVYFEWKPKQLVFGED